MKERIKRFVIEACCHFIVLTVSIEKTKLILYRYITQKGYLICNIKILNSGPSLLGGFRGKSVISLSNLFNISISVLIPVICLSDNMQLADKTDLAKIIIIIILINTKRGGAQWVWSKIFTYLAEGLTQQWRYKTQERWC